MDPADLARLQSTKGGDSETELKEFAVSPTKPPVAVRAVTIVTPVANMPKAWRNSVGEKVGAKAPDDVAIEGMAAIYLILSPFRSRAATILVPLGADSRIR